MANKQLKVTAKARQDLLGIGRYTQGKWGVKQRNHYLKQLDDAFRLLCENPLIGRERSYVKLGYRSYQQGSHVIYYKATDAVEIIRVLHKRMDVELHLQ